MKKRVLLFASNFMDIYKDIKESLEDKGMEVIWVQAGTIPNNPYKKFEKGAVRYDLDLYMSRVEEMWTKRINEDDMKCPFDYFLAINGLDAHPLIFNYLRKNNPSIRMVLFLYDRVEGVVQIDSFFNFYDDVYSFDLGDTNQFGLNFMPIYWKPSKYRLPTKYDIFGFASFSFSKPERTKLYKEIACLSEKEHLRSFIKLYYGNKNSNSICYFFKYLIMKTLCIPAISPKEITNTIYTNKTISPVDYRMMISMSRAILDTQASYQDGLTARFMWALGEGKKIITTNESVMKYPFYTPDQFYILNENNLSGILEFLQREFVMTKLNREYIEQYRIDNWLDTMLMLNNP